LGGCVRAGERETFAISVFKDNAECRKVACANAHADTAD
jgi:hypothetical protein